MLRSILKTTAQWLWVARYSLVKYDEASAGEYESISTCIRTLCQYAYL